MKMILEFSNDEIYDAKAAIRGVEFAGAIDDVYEYIRGILKHTDVSEETSAHLEKIRDMLPSTEI